MNLDSSRFAAMCARVRASFYLVALTATLLVSHSSLPAFAQVTPAATHTGALPDAITGHGAAATPSGERARCVIHIKGPATGATFNGPGTASGSQYTGKDLYSGGGVSSASMDCEGGPVTIAVNDTLLGPYESGFHGVNISASCPRGQQYPGCLLTVCDDTVVDVIDSFIGGVKGAKVALCVTGTADVVLVNSTIRDNFASGILAADDSRVVLSDRNTSVSNNIVVRDNPYQQPYSGSAVLAVGVSAIDSAHVLITGGASVADNLAHAYVEDYEDYRDPCDRIVRAYQSVDSGMGQKGQRNGAAGVLVSGNASMVISNSSFVIYNRAYGDCAGGLVAGFGTLLVTSNSVVQSNKASVNGGGLCARDHGRLTVGNESRIVDNGCGSFGCGVLVDGDATVVVEGPVTVGGNRFLQDGSGEGQCDKLCLQQRNRYRVEGKDTGGGAFAVGVNGSLLLHGPVDVANNAAYVFGDGILAFGDAKVQIGSGVNFTRQPSRGLAVSGWDVTTTDRAVLFLHKGVLSGGMPLNVCNASIRLGSIMCPPGTFTTSSGCTCCSPGMYDFSNESRANATCSQCPLNALCNDGNVLPLLGHWRSSNRSVQIHRCPAYSTSCRGGEDTGNGTCQAGYTGVQCGVCASGYGMTVPFRCVRCLPPAKQLMLYLALAGTCLVLITYTVHATWKDNRRGDKSVRVSDIIKVPAQFLQYLVILGSVSAPWPSFLTAAFTTAAAVFGAAGGQSSSLDCWVKHSLAHIKLPPSIVRQLVLFIAPVVVLVVVMMLVLLSHVLKRVWSAAAARRDGLKQRRGVPALQLVSRLHVAALVTAFFAYPTLVKASLGMFACLRVDDAASKEPYPQYAVKNHTAGYWVLDMDQACFAGWHRSWAFGLGLTAVAVICIGAPLAIWLFMWRNSGRASDSDFQQRYGFLFHNYKQGCFWWEAVWAAQTVSLTAVSVFHYSIGAYHALLLMCLSLLVSLALQVWWKPYEAKLLHRLHLASTWCLIASIWIALNMFHLQNTAPHTALHTFLGALMVVVDTAFVLWCVLKIVQLAHHTLKPVQAFAGCLQRCFGAAGSGSGKSSGSSSGVAQKP